MARQQNDFLLLISVLLERTGENVAELGICDGIRQSLGRFPCQYRFNFLGWKLRHANVLDKEILRSEAACHLPAFEAVIRKQPSQHVLRFLYPRVVTCMASGAHLALSAHTIRRAAYRTQFLCTGTITSRKEPDMKKTLWVAGLIILTISLLPLPTFCQDKLTIQAKMFSYKTLCEFTDPPHSSDYSIKATNDKVTLEVTECRAFEKKHANAAAVLIAMKNGGSAPAEVAIDKDLASVEITSKDNQVVKAVAKRFMVEGPMGGKKMEFVTRVEASYTIKLEAGQEANIVYLFPKAATGETIKIGNLEPRKIE